jgi:hypothetical protein
LNYVTQATGALASDFGLLGWKHSCLCLFLDRDKIIAAADEAGIAIVEKP